MIAIVLVAHSAKQLSSIFYLSCFIVYAQPAGTAACEVPGVGAGADSSMAEWARVMKDAGTRENGSRPGRVRSHRPTGAEGAFAAKDRCSGGLHTAV